MKLKECIHGVLVTDKDRNRVGMIVGITNNRPNQSLENRIGVEYAIPVVQWSDGETFGIHPCNLIPL